MTSKPSSSRVVATIEARMTSSRLPGKVLMPAGGKPLLQILVERLRQAQGIDQIVIATTVNATDDPIATLAQRLNVGLFRGSENDVLGRVCGALRAYQADICVEITADCPLLDPHLVEDLLAEFKRTQDQNPYISNAGPDRSTPDGLDVQVFWAKALFTLEAETKDPLDREHVSYGFYRPEGAPRWNPRHVHHPSCRDAGDILITLDFAEDYDIIKRIHEELSVQKADYGVKDIIAWVRAHSDLERRCHEVREVASKHA